jgi:peroxiredoxin Q/BCP
MQAFQSDFVRFAEHNAQVLGVSSDSLETHREFAAKLGLGFPLIADDGTVCKLYGGGRITYLIDQSGVIRYIHKGMPDNKTLIHELASMNAL